MWLGRHIRRGFFPACGAAALLVLAGAAPVARAACGDYVTVVRPGDNVAQDQTQPAHPPAPRCHGPECSSPPTQAAPVNAPRLIERPSLDLAAEPGAADSEPARGRIRGPDSALTSARLTADIFHPPRTC